MKRGRLVFGTFFFLLSACGGGDAPTGPAPDPPSDDPDRDGDGILNSVDACPDAAEVFNNLLDEDGCPDDTLEYYDAVRIDAESFWSEIFSLVGARYQGISVFAAYETSADTPCGEVGPVDALYCPLDEGVYYHLGFLDEALLELGDAAPAMVVAHEVAHHAQNLDGVLDLLDLGLVTRKQVELQADCYTGAWGAWVVLRGLLEQARVEEALEILLALGEEGLAGPWFDPAVHGTSLERNEAFDRGLLGGLSACVDPFFFPAAVESGPR